MISHRFIIEIRGMKNQSQVDEQIHRRTSPQISLKSVQNSIKNESKIMQKSIKIDENRIKNQRKINFFNNFAIKWRRMHHFQKWLYVRCWFFTKVNFRMVPAPKNSLKRQKSKTNQTKSVYFFAFLSKIAFFTSKFRFG